MCNYTQQNFVWGTGRLGVMTPFVEDHKINTFAGHQTINRSVLSLSLLITTESRMEIFLLCVTMPTVGKTEVYFPCNSSIYPATHPNKTQRHWG